MSDWNSSESETCQGNCLSELHTIIETSAVTELVKIVRDYRRSDKIKDDFKDFIISETNDMIKLMKQRATDMLTQVDEFFRDRQDSQHFFYSVCHKLAVEKMTCPGERFTMEPICDCFSEENLEKYKVDSEEDLHLVTSLETVKNAIDQYNISLRCSTCKDSLNNCCCPCPSMATQHQVREVILKKCAYLKDDSRPVSEVEIAENTNKSLKSSLSSDESEDSYEFISSPDQKIFAKENIEDFECLENECSRASSIDDFNVVDIIEPKVLNDRWVNIDAKTEVTDASKKNTSFEFQSELEGKNNVSNKNKTDHDKVSPAAIVKQSFSSYIKRSDKESHSLIENNITDVKKVSPAQSLSSSAQKLRVFSNCVDGSLVEKELQRNSIYKKALSAPSEGQTNSSTPSLIERKNIQDSFSVKSPLKAFSSTKIFNHIPNQNKLTPSNSLKQYLNSNFMSKTSQKWSAQNESQKVPTSNQYFIINLANKRPDLALKYGLISSFGEDFH